MTSLVAPGGEPVAPALEAEVKRLDPDFGLRLCGTFWAVTVKWLKGDTRRAMVRSGEMSEDDAFDMFAQLPVDCPPDQAAGYIIARQGQWELDNPTYARRIDWLQKENAKVRAAHMEPLLAYAEELVDANQDTLFDESSGLEHKNRVRVFQSESLTKPESGKKRTKGRDL